MSDKKIKKLMPQQLCPVFYNARISPSHTAIIDGDNVFSYRQLNAFIEAAISYFNKRGISQDDLVIIHSPTNAAYLVALCALWRIGAVACPLNIHLPQAAIERQQNYLQARHFLRSRQVDLKLYASYSGEKIHTIYPEKTATVLFTSGTTADPKAAVHTWDNHWFSACASNRNIPVKRGDRWMLSLPLYHVSGLGIFFRTLQGQGTLVIPPYQENISLLIRQYHVTHLSVVPTQLQRLLKQRFWGDSLKAILLGGASIDDHLLKKARKKKLPVYQTYGMTEMSSQVATSPKPFQEPRILRGYRVKISEEGEILVKGKSLFQGYRRKDGSVDLARDKAGWFHTGDLGKIMKKRLLKVSGRKDNMFISGGENIQPEEIERYLRAYEGIEQSVVIPVKHKEFGWRPVAFLKLKKKEALNTEEIRNFLSQYLPKFKCPDRFLLWPEKIPSQMKIKRSDFYTFLQENEA